MYFFLPKPVLWLWIEPLGWLVMPKSRFSYSYRPTPSLPLAKLTLCFLARDWEAIFVEEELINGASYSPDRTDNRMPKPPGEETQLQLVQGEYRELERILHSDASTLMDSRRGFRALFRGEPLGDSIWDDASKNLSSRASKTDFRVLERCVDCGSPAIPGERTCYTHHRK